MSESMSLTPQEVAEVLKIAKNTVYELIKRGELNAYRVGRKIRIDKSDVEEYKVKTGSQKSNLARYEGAHSIPLQINEMTCDKGLVICGQDIVLDILARHLEQHPKGIQALRSYIASYNSLYALYHGKVQVSAAHLWDGDTGQYNIPYVKRMVPGIPLVVVHVGCRMQGFYVSKGNPKNIKGWEDLKRPDISITNREKGCGTRVLLDEHLRLMGIYGSSIKGYNTEYLSHLAVASSVARGEADLGLGNEKVALQVQGVDFIPLQKERYELVIKKEDLAKPEFQAIIEIINSDNFKMEIYGIGGYDLNETGKIVSEI